MIIKRINKWVNAVDIDVAEGRRPFDPISHGLFVLNKAILVYLMLPFFVVMGILWVVTG